jgi:DNA-binding NarL/FixJ family response regulator
MVRILIADDHEIVRAGLQQIVEAHCGWQVVATAANGREAIEKTVESKPDVAIIDYSLPLINGLEVTRQVRARSPRTEVLVFTMHDNEALIMDLLQAGARGYLLKSDANRHLIAAIDALHFHRPYLTSKVSEALLQSYKSRSPQSLPKLTVRERQVVQLIAEGHNNKAIARLLNISHKTVETHRSAAMRKLNLRSSAALVRYAVRNKIVED